MEKGKNIFKKLTVVYIQKGLTLAVLVVSLVIFFIILYFLGGILINLEWCVLIISMDQGYFEALGIFRSFYKGILVILEVLIVFGKFSRLVFWSF